METSASAAAAGYAPRTIPETPTDAQLRKEYEDSEIKRFLHVFSTYVIEVKAKAVTEPNPEARTRSPSPNPLAAPSIQTLGASASEYPFPAAIDPGTASNASLEGTPCISDYVAKHWVAPYLPLRQHEVGPFTLARVRLTMNRLYIVAQIHLPHLKALGDLALWTDYETSLVGCITFWVLWWYNFLLPACMAWMLYGVLRRGLLPYPTVQDLREHRSRLLQADEFSASLSSQISPTSTLDIKELWRLFQLARTDWKTKFKASQKERQEAKDIKAGKIIDEDNASEVDEPTIFDNTGDLSAINEIPNLKRYLLHVLTEIVDFHERLRNIGIWRNPAASKRYSLILLAAFIATAYVPAQYLVKATYATLGSIFWHGIPLLCALPSEHRKRIPMPFADVPTDAEYAMQLISERVARGEDVQALLKEQRSISRPPTPPQLPPRPGSISPHSTKGPVNKMKAIGKIIGDEGSRLAHGHAPKLATHPLWNGAMAVLSPGVNPEVYTFPAQRGTAPGLITLTSKRLLFNPVVSSQIKVDVDLDSITGVKKSGVLRGLQVSYTDPETKAEVEEKFHWVNDRDELFARLVGMGKQKWQNV